MNADERVVPGVTPVTNLMKHIARYNLALQHSVDRRVVDAACGTGYGSKLLSMVAKEVVGWDIDKETVDYALAHFGAENVAYYTLDLDKLNTYKLNTIGAHTPFDTLVCFETLEHLDDPHLFLNRVMGLLAKKATIVASVPLNETEGFNKHHKHVYTLETAKALFSGFNHVASTIQSAISFYPAEPEYGGEPYSYFVYVGKVR